MHSVHSASTKTAPVACKCKLELKIGSPFRVRKDTVPGMARTRAQVAPPKTRILKKSVLADRFELLDPLTAGFSYKEIALRVDGHIVEAKLASHSAMVTESRYWLRRVLLNHGIVLTGELNAKITET